MADYECKWTVCTHGAEKYRNVRDKNNRWSSKLINVTAEIEKLLKASDIAYRHGKDIKSDIAAVKDTKFYKCLYRLLQVTVSLRHSKIGSNKDQDDYILSPVKAADGSFFDSRKATDKQPKNADANGAYHIALKGLWNLEQINKWNGEGKPKLSMKNADWFQFLAGFRKR